MPSYAKQRNVHTVRTSISVEREYRQIHGMMQYPRRVQGYGFWISCRLYITTNACAPIPLQWIPCTGPIFAFRSVIRSVKLAKIGRGDEATSGVPIRHERIMLQFFPIILLRIAQKFSRLFSILFSTFFDIFTDLNIIHWCSHIHWSWHRWNLE